MTDKNRIVFKVGWITQMKSTPPLTQEYIERQYKFFENQVKVLQDNGFTTKNILEDGEKANNDSEIKLGDLTEQGIKFYYWGIRAWMAKYDRSKDKDKAINDFKFIEKKLKEFPDKEKDIKLNLE